MQFNNNNLPKLGQKVRVVGHKQDQIGFVFGITQRYYLNPLIIVDVNVTSPEDMLNCEGKLINAEATYVHSIED